MMEFPSIIPGIVFIFCAMLRAFDMLPLWMQGLFVLFVVVRFLGLPDSRGKPRFRAGLSFMRVI